MAGRSLCSRVCSVSRQRGTAHACSGELWYSVPFLLLGAVTPSRLCYSIGPPSHASPPPTEGPNNPLLKQLRDQIRMTGPLTVHQYMRAVLTHPRGGYYMGRDVLGRAGDFITSPEISQMFGELVGVWVYSEWYKMGRVQPLQLVELGPGRGTLTMDVLRVLSQLGLSGDAVQVHLVELSPYYRDMQRRALCVESSIQDRSPSDSNQTTNAHTVNKINYIDENSPSADDPIEPIMSDITVTKSPVHWHDHLDCVPPGFSMILAHEFFDCLPIHRLVKKEGKWREVLVDINGDVGYGGYGDAAANDGQGKASGMDGGSDGRRSKVADDGKRGWVEEIDDRRNEDADDDKSVPVEGNDGIRSKTSTDDKSLVVMDFGDGDVISSSDADLPLRYVISRTCTPASTLYTEALENRESAEVSPEAAVLMQQISRRLQERGGALLMVDYGHSGTKGDTFRKLVQSCRDPQQRKALVSGYKRLLEDLGASFKVMAVYPSVMRDLLQKYPPPGFYRNLEGAWQGEADNDPEQEVLIAKLKNKMFEPKLGDGNSELK